MRWLLVDQFSVIQKGKYAKGIRSVTRSEDALAGDYPSFPIMPPTLLLEMMAQVGGVLVGATIGFSKEVVLAKISQAAFLKRIEPPSILEIEACLSELGDDAAETKCRISRSGELVAEGVIFFGLFTSLDGHPGKSIVFSKSFMESFAIRELMAKSEIPREAG